MSEQLKQEFEADTDRLETGTVAGSETIGEQEEKPTEGKLEVQEGDESKEEDTVPMGKASLADIVSGIPAPTSPNERNCVLLMRNLYLHDCMVFMGCYSF